MTAMKSFVTRSAAVEMVRRAVSRKGLASVRQDVTMFAIAQMTEMATRAESGECEQSTPDGAQLEVLKKLL